MSNKIRVADQTIRRWFSLLQQMYYCFEIRPWSKNIVRSLLKDPKVYLWDWSDVKDKGPKFENFVASHLYKFVNFWTETGHGEFGLYYVRNKEKKEVDFLVTKDKIPWFLVEAKASNDKELSKNLGYFKEQLNCPHAFQVTLDSEYAHADCFKENGPIKVPAKTFLSQLI